jgi:hypothetical protein
VVVLEVRLFTALKGLGIYIDGRSDDINLALSLSICQRSYVRLR